VGDGIVKESQIYALMAYRAQIQKKCCAKALTFCISRGRDGGCQKKRANIIARFFVIKTE
jgi:hypothetical protein